MSRAIHLNTIAPTSAKFAGPLTPIACVKLVYGTERMSSLGSADRTELYWDAWVALV